MCKLYIFILVLLCFGCQQKERIVKQPVFGACDNINVEIDRIVLSDSATTFYVKSKNPGNKCISGVQRSYLSVDTAKFPLTGTRGIEVKNLREALITSDGDCFELIYPPLPRSVQAVDWILDSDKFTVRGIWDIQLGKNRLDVEERIPEEFLNGKIDLSREWRPVVLTSGKTRLKVNLVGFRPEMKKGGQLSWQGLVNHRKEFTIDDNGVGVVEFMQYGAMATQLFCAGVSVNVLLFPGEDAEIYVDMAEIGRRRCTYRQMEPARPMFYYNGYYEDLNTVLMNDARQNSLSDPKEWEERIKGLDAEQYVALCKKDYQDKIREWEQADTLSKECIHYYKLKALDQLVGRVNGMDRHFKLVAGVVPKSTDKPKLDYYKALRELPVNTYDFLLLANNSLKPITYCLDSREKLKAYLNVETGLLVDLVDIKPFQMNFFEGMPFDEEQMILFDQFSPFVKKMFEEVHQHNLAWEKEKKAQSGYKGCEIPDVPDDQVYDSIMAKYKGKVVFVDFWATWCGPCKSGIKAMRPIRQEMQKKGVAFVFITYESSPLKDWEWQIPDIEGDHYRLTRKQFGHITKRFKFNGIPHYRLVKKSGENECYLGGTDDLRETLMKEL